ncbi:hypothetical protein ON05_029980 (plasmid) [Acaryochloris sp. CCMEE 5410]|nr:hypothetical protein ON05_029980 [Acaryochloris sp. CCMEE 5410]
MHQSKGLEFDTVSLLSSRRRVPRFRNLKGQIRGRKACLLCGNDEAKKALYLSGYQVAIADIRNHQAAFWMHSQSYKLQSHQRLKPL